MNFIYATRCHELKLTKHETPLQGLHETPLLPFQPSLQEAQREYKDLQTQDFQAACSKALFFASQKEKDSSLMGLSLHEAAAIHLFSQETPLFHLVNECLCTEKREMLKPFLPLIKLLLSALYKLPPIPAKVYKGAKRDLGGVLLKHEIFILWPFTFTLAANQSLEALHLLAKEEERTIVCLQVTSGVDIAPFSASGCGEGEILLPPGTCFMVEEILPEKEGICTFKLEEKAIPGLLDFPRLARGSFPSRNLHFLGREREMEEIKKRLLANGRPKEAFSQVIIAGGGGMGKSSLALEYLHRNYSSYTFARWLPSEQNVAEELKEMGISLGITEQNTVTEEAARSVVKFLETRSSGWLLVYDNVESAKHLRGLVPDPGRSAKGHVIITTRDQAMAKVPHQVLQLGALSHMEGVDVLLHYCGKEREQLGEEELGLVEEICQELGDLPLGLTQAGSFMRENETSFVDYLSLIRSQRKELMTMHAPPEDHPFSLVSTWKISVDKIRKISPASILLLRRSLFLHPEDIPQKLLIYDSECTPLGKRSWIGLVKPLLRYSLLSESKPGYFSIHRLIQSTLRDGLGEEQKRLSINEVTAALEREWRFEHNQPSTWESSRQLVPHLEALLSHGEVGPQTSRLLYGLGYYYIFLDVNLVLAEDYMRRSLEMNRAIYSNCDHPDTAMSLFGLGLTKWSQGNPSEALDFHQQSLAMRRKIYGNNPHPDLARSLNNLGIVYRQQGNLAKAIDYYTQSLEIRKKLYGNENPDVAISLNNLGNAYSSQGNVAHAIDYYTQSLEIAKRIHGDCHPDVATSLNNLGNAYNQQGILAKAIQHHSQALEIRKKIHGDEHPDVASSLDNLGSVYYSQGKLDLAVHYYTQSLDMRRKIFGEEHPDVAISLNNLGTANKELGNLELAMDLFTQSLGMKKRFFGDQHPSTQLTANNLEDVHETPKEQAPNPHCIIS